MASEDLFSLSQAKVTEMSQSVLGNHAISDKELLLAYELVTEIPNYWFLEGALYKQTSQEEFRLENPKLLLDRLSDNLISKLMF